MRQLAERLRDAGLRVWFDEWTVHPGDDASQMEVEGIKRSRMLLLCVSPNALASGWVALERSTAIHRDPANVGRRFIPVLLADCEMPNTLRRYKHVNFEDASDYAMEELLALCPPETQFAHRAPDEDHNKYELDSDDRSQDDARFGLECRRRFETPGYVYRLAWSADGRHIAAACDDGSVRIWDVTDGRQEWELAHASDPVFAVAFSSSNGLLAGAGRGGHITIWSTSTGEQLHSLAGHPSDVWDLAFSPDGTLLASASDDGYTALWNVVTGKRDSFLSCGAVEVWCTRFSRSGAILVSGSTDGVVHVWDVSTRACIKKLAGHNFPVFSIAFSPNNELLATCSVDRSVRVWSTKTLEPIAILEGHHGSIEALDFSFDGSFLATKSLAARGETPPSRWNP